MSDNNNGLYDELNKAQSKLMMVRDSCEAMSYAETFHTEAKRLSRSWFEGTAQVCREIIEVMDNVLDVGMKQPEA